VRRIFSSSNKEIYTDLRKTLIAKFGKHSCIPALLLRLAQQYSKSGPGNPCGLTDDEPIWSSRREMQSIFLRTAFMPIFQEIFVECMARSNNVLNTGFCPRADRDSIELFTSALTFSPHSSEDAILIATNSDKELKGAQRYSLHRCPSLTY
jgi:mannose-6-phosphate isomerase